jgi:hypothetical protein
MPHTVTTKLRCVERELKRRYLLYERMIDEGVISRIAAECEIAIMEDIAADYRALDEGYMQLVSVAACNHPGEAATKPGPPHTHASPLVRRSR